MTFPEAIKKLESMGYRVVRIIDLKCTKITGLEVYSSALMMDIFEEEIQKALPDFKVHGNSNHEKIYIDHA